MPHLLGESAVDAAARVELLSCETQSRWTCARSRHLRNSRISKWVKHARHHKSWGRALRWLKEFEGFAAAMCTANEVPYNARLMRADDDLCCHFLTQVADEMKGVSRVVAARRALSGQRLREGALSLNSVHDVTLLVDGVRNAQPKTRHQVESLDINDVTTIAAALSKAVLWQERQLGVLIALGFLTIMRYGELQRVRRDGIRIIFTSGKEQTMSDMSYLPNADRVAGILIHLPWRKSKQAADAWIPLSCRSTIRQILHHERTLRSLRCRSHRLFPSVSRKAGKLPHHNNFFGATQFRAGLRRCLRTFCHMDDEEVKAYGGHSLRVGGSNFMRRMKVDPDIHRAMGGWSILKSAREYMQLTPTEQFAITRKLAVKKERTEAFSSRSRARTALSAVPRLS